MHRAAWFAGFVLCLGGCGPSVQESLRTYNEDGVYLFQHGQYDGARQNFEAALALQPENTGMLYNIGECYDHQGRKDDFGAERFEVDHGFNVAGGSGRLNVGHPSHRAGRAPALHFN